MAICEADRQAKEAHEAWHKLAVRADELIRHARLAQDEANTAWERYKIKRKAAGWADLQEED